MIYPSGTVTLLVVGLKSCSTSSEGAVKELNRMFTKHRGYLFAKNDFSFKLAFEELSDALGFALQVKKEIANTFSIGIDRGYVSMEQNQFGEVTYGGCVMDNARYFSERASAGELATSRNCFEMFKDSLADSQLHSQFLIVDDTMKTNLVKHGESFVGRSDAFEHIDKLLEEEHALITVTGPKGTGKTKFSQSWGGSKFHQYPAGVWFVDLSEAKTLDSLCSDLAVVLSTPLLSPDPVQQLGEVFKGMCDSARGPMLVLLDNCKNITSEVAAALRRWMAIAPQVQFLVTNREALNVKDETEVSLTGLDCPSEQDIEDCRALLSFTAVQLFYSRCQELHTGFKARRDNLQDIARVCCILKGSALAIELAATLLEFFSPDMLLSRFEQDDADDPIELVLSWSWEILRADEKLALAQLSVFKNAFSLGFAEKVLDFYAVEGAVGLSDVLARLKKKGFIKPHAFKMDDNDPMWHLDDSVKEFASLKLKEMGQFEETELRWQTWLLDYSRYWWNCYNKRPTSVVMQRMNQVLEDLLNLARSDEIEEEEAAWAMVYATPFLMRLGPLSSGVSIIKKCFKALGICVTRLESGELVVPPNVDEELADYLVLAYSGFHLLENHSLTIRILTTLKDKNHLAALVSRSLVWSYFSSGDMLRARELALKLLEREDLSPYTFICAKNILGLVYMNAGNYEEAIQHLKEAIDVAEETDLDISREYLVGNLGVVYLNLGEYGRSLMYFKEAQMLADSFNSRSSLSAWVGNQGEIYIRTNEKDKALRYCREALMLARKLGQQKCEAVWLGNEGICYARFRIDHDEAIKKMKQVINIFRKIGAKNLLAMFLGHLANTYVDQVVYGLIDESQYESNCRLAMKCLEESQTLQESCGLKRQYAFEMDRSYCEHFFSRTDKAKDWARKALDFAEDQEIDASAQYGRYKRQFDFCFQLLGLKTAQG